MSDQESADLDHLLRSAPRGVPQLPPEVAQALNLVKVEQVLSALLEKAAGGHCQALEVVKRNLADGGPPDVVKAAGERLLQTRERLVGAVNDLSAFSIEPVAWLAQARASGRVVQWRQFGVV